MTLASWFSSLRHSRRPARVRARRDRRCAPGGGRRSTPWRSRPVVDTVSSGAPSESLDGSSGGFTISVSLSSPPSGTPIVSPFASINGPGGLAFDSAGNLYAADSGDGTVDKVTPAGTVSTYASGFNDPVAVAVDSAGNLYVADSGDGTVDRVTPAGVKSTFASGLNRPVALTFDPAGNLYVATKGDESVTQVTPGDVASTYATGFGDPLALAFNAGNLYVANFEGDSVSRVAPGATTGGTIFVSGLIGPEGLAFDAAGDLFVANLAGTVSEVPPAGGTATTFAPGFDVPTGLAFDSAGNLYVANKAARTRWSSSARR